MTTSKISSNKNGAMDVFSGGGEMGARMRSLNWAETPLGPVESWSQALLTSVSICLNSRFPMAVWWGRELVLLYNDGWRTVLGADEDLIALSNRGEKIRDDVSSMLSQVFDTGEATGNDDRLLLVNRSGANEEVYFTWSFSPISDDDGVGGVFTTVIETTRRVIDERRRQTLRNLRERSLAESDSVAEACRAASETLLANAHDFPFAMIYLLDEDGKTARLAQTVRMESNPEPAKADIIVGSPNDHWKLAEVLAGKKPVEIDELDKKFGRLTAGAWTDDTTRKAFVVPLAKAGTNGFPTGFLICGLSPRRPFDPDYRSFLEAAAEHTATAIANARTLETEHRQALNDESTVDLAEAADAFKNVVREIGVGIPEPFLERMYERIDRASRTNEPALQVNDTDLTPVRELLIRIAHDHSRNSSTLQKREEFYTVISELSTDWAYTARIEPDGAIVTEAVTDGFTRLFGYTADELMKAGGWGVIVHPDDIAAARKQMERLLAGEAISGEMRHITKDGKILWLQYQTRPVLDEEGRVIRLFGASTDITLRKEAEEQILSLNRELENRLEEQKTLFDLLPVGVCIAQDRELNYLYANRYLNELTKLGAGNVSAYNPDIEVTKGWVYYRNGREIGVDELPLYLAVKTEKPVTDYEFDILLPERERALTLVANTAPLFDEKGSVRGAIGGFLNITERKQMEQALTATATSLYRERERLNIALRTGALGVYEWVVGEESIWWSPEMFPVYGVEAGSFMPTIQSFSELIHPDDRDEFWEHCRECTARHEIFHHEYRIIRPDGSIRWLYNCSQVGMDEAGNAVRITGVAADVTERKQAEAALQKSEAEFRQLANAVPQIVWVSDGSGRTIYVNHQWKEFSGLGVDETVQPDLMAKIYHPNDREKVLEAWSKAVGNGATFEVEARLRNHRTGEYRWFLIRSEPNRDSDGRIVKWFGTSTDITARKESENRARLLARISELSRKFEDPNQLLYEVACAVGEHLEVRRCLFNEIDTENDLEIVHRDYCNGLESVAGRHRISVYSSLTSAEMASGRTVVNYDSKTDGRTAPYFERTYGPAGERAYVAVPLLRENRWVASLWISDDKPRQWSRSEVSLLEFIAEQVWAVVEKLRLDIVLRESEARFRNMADHAPVMIWVTDETGYCTYISQSWYEFTGQTPDSGLGFGWLSVIHPEDQKRTENEFELANASRSPVKIEYRMRNSSGEMRWAIDSARPRFAENGAFLGYIGSVIDITERKTSEQEREKLLEQEKILREEAEKANRLKDEFLATVSHELRTPLNAILGWATMAQRNPGDPATTVRALEVIERSARNQNQIISDILDVSRIITGKLHLEISPLRLSSVISSAIDSLRPMLNAKRIELATSLEPDEDRIYSGDPDRLQQVFWNLLSNAAKFTPDGGRVEIVLRYRDEAAEIVVKDTGEGIAPEFLPYVFDRFRQADGKKNRRHGGLGLGLAVVRHLTELHGGEVFVESDGIGKGTTFWVALPMTDYPGVSKPSDPAQRSLDNENDSRRVKGRARTARRLEGVRILVIDDERDAVELVEFILSNEGAEILTSDSATDALGKLDGRELDLIISDIGMPGIDGFELIRRIRRIEDPANRQIPALALTAYAGENDSRRALELGYNAYLPKPLEPAELIGTIIALTGTGSRAGQKL